MNISTGRFRPIGRLSLFPAWTRPDSYWDVVVSHFPLALLTGLGLILPFWVSLHSFPFMKCTFMVVTGFPCPFCGFTRSIWAISAGDWYFALCNCPLSLGIYVLMAIFFAWHSTALLLGIRMTSGFYQLCRLFYTWWIIAGLFFLNWVYRIGFGPT